MESPVFESNNLPQPASGSPSATYYVDVAFVTCVFWSLAEIADSNNRERQKKLKEIENQIEGIPVRVVLRLVACVHSLF
jgi:hypothetical protein